MPRDTKMYYVSESQNLKDFEMITRANQSNFSIFQSALKPETKRFKKGYFSKERGSVQISSRPSTS